MTGSTYLSWSARWNAVKTRDPGADGYFIYAVRTTKIYCRPVCKARLARQANVVFYDSAEEAERAGYRACKRCKPQLLGQMPEENAVVQIRALIEQRLPRAEIPGRPSDLKNLAELAREAGLSKWHFHRVFKEVTGLTPMAYLRQRNQDYSFSETDLTSSQPSGSSAPATRVTEDSGDRRGQEPAVDPALIFDDINFDDFLADLDAEGCQDIGQMLDNEDWS